MKSQSACAMPLQADCTPPPGHGRSRLTARGEPGDAAGLGPVPDLRPHLGGREFLLVGQAVHARDAHVCVRLGVGPAERVFSAFFRPSAASDGAGDHVAGAPKSNGMMVKLSILACIDAALLISLVPAKFGPVCVVPERDDRLDAGVVLLDDLQSAQDPVLHGVVLELVGVLDVDVDALQVVRR